MRIRDAAMVLPLVLAVACDDGVDRTPTSPSLKPSPPPLTCSFQRLSSVARDEFGTPEQQTALGVIGEAETAPANSSARDAKLLDLLRFLTVTVDQERETGDPTVAEALVNEAVLCGSTALKAGLSLPLDVDKSFDHAHDGAAAVRGLASDGAEAIITRHDGSILALKDVNCPVGSTTPNSWGCALGTRALILAQTGTAVTNEQPLGTTYLWRSVPDIDLLANRTLVGAICTSNARSLLQEDEAILFLEDVGFLEFGHPWNCPPSPQASVQGPWRFASIITRLLMPAPAVAAVMRPQATGGRLKGFSTFTVVDAVALDLTIDPLPKQGFTNTPITLTLHVVAAQEGVPSDFKTPVEGAVLEITVSGNQGGFTITPPTPAHVTTGLDGSASIAISSDKAGGYTFLAKIIDLENSSTPIQNYLSDEEVSTLINLKLQR